MPRASSWSTCPAADSLYFTMLNHKQAFDHDQHEGPTGKEISRSWSRNATCWSRTSRPRARSHGLRLGAHPGDQPAHDHGLGQGFGPGPYEDCKVYENVAQCTGGAASTTGFLDGPPTVTGPRSVTAVPACISRSVIVTALFQREKSGRGQRVLAAMQTAFSTSAASSCVTSSASRVVP